jgi:hypothetical protein
MFWHISYFMHVRESKVYSQTKKWAFFIAEIIFNDLMHVQKRLIHRFNSVQWKRLIYFVWSVEQETEGNAKFQDFSLLGYF